MFSIYLNVWVYFRDEILSKNIPMKYNLYSILSALYIRYITLALLHHLPRSSIDCPSNVNVSNHLFHSCINSKMFWCLAIEYNLIQNILRVPCRDQLSQGSSSRRYDCQTSAKQNKNSFYLTRFTFSYQLIILSHSLYNLHLF